MMLVTIVPLMAMFCSEVIAAANRPIHFVAGVIRKHDDNLFRQDNNAKSDNITGLSAGLVLDKKLGLQRITAEATISDYRYSKNRQLDFVSKAYEIALHWSLTPRLTGKISADRSQRLNDFNDTQNEGRNIRTSRNQAFIADFNPTGGWHVLAGVSRQTLDNSQTFNQDASFSANAADAGIKYIFPSGSSMKAMHHTRKGKFEDRTISQVNLFDDGYKENETEAELDWLLTVKSSVKANVSYIKREHDNFSTRDFSGIQTKLAYDWSPTAKVRVVTAMQSRLSSFQTNVDSYTRTNQLTLQPRYAITEKINLSGNLLISERNFLGRGYDASTQSSRVDKFKSIGFGAEWKPTLDSSIEAKLSHYDQNSNINRFDFKGNLASISAEILF